MEVSRLAILELPIALINAYPFSVAKINLEPIENGCASANKRRGGVSINSFGGLIPNWEVIEAARYPIGSVYLRLWKADQTRSELKKNKRQT